MNETVMTFLKTFLVGGALCLIGQLFMADDHLPPVGPEGIQCSRFDHIFQRPFVDARIDHTFHKILK